MAKRVPPFTADDDRHELAAHAATNARVRKSVVHALSGEDRRLRQFAASVIREVAETHAELLKEYVADLADALHRPESQTRWEVLGAFESLVCVDARLVDKALAGAETALHDEESGVVRLAAFRMLTTYGATTPHRSERVWPLIAEAVRCYHGDDEFSGMLTALYRLVSGNASDDVKISAAELMAFDAESGKGLLKRRASRIVACAPKKRSKK